MKDSCLTLFHFFTSFLSRKIYTNSFASAALQAQFFPKSPVGDLPLQKGRQV